MPRYARLDSPGVLQHVIVRGNEKRKIFLDDRDRERFLDRLAQLLAETETRCYAWSLLPNHFHLLLLPIRFKVAVLMRRLLTSHAVTFNLIHRRTGHLFQNRYRSIVCDKESYLLELIRYIHLNPLRAGLVKTLEELDRYPWSGHSVLMGNYSFEQQDVEEVLERFGRGLESARVKYRQYVGEGVEIGRREDLLRTRTRGRPLKSVVGRDRRVDPRILGDRQFSERILSNRPIREKAHVFFPIGEFIERVSSILGIDPGLVRRPSKHRRFAEARAIICYMGVREMGYSGMELGQELRLGTSGVSRALTRGESLLSEKPEMKESLLRQIVK